MKRLFTLAIVAMIASLTFAQAPVAKQTPRQLQKVVKVDALTKQAQQAKAKEAAKAEKAAAAQVTSTSVLRRSVKSNAGSEVMGGKVLQGVKFNSARTVELSTNSAVKKSVKKHATLQGASVKAFEAKGQTLQRAEVQPTVRKAPKKAEGNVAAAEVEGAYDFKYYGILTNNSGWNTSNITITATSATELSVVGFYGSYPVTATLDADGTVTIPTGQFLVYNSNYDEDVLFTTYRWNEAGDDIVPTDALVGTYNDGVISFDEDDIFFAEISFGYFTGGYAMSMTKNENYVAPSTELVVVPEGAEVMDGYLSGYSSEEDFVNKPVKVAYDGLDVYVQGWSLNYPESWIKGTVDPETLTVTFPQAQYIGNYAGIFDMWFMGTVDWETVCDVTASFDSDTFTLTFNEDILENADLTEPYCLEYYYDIVITAAPAGGETGDVTVEKDENGIITSVTGGTTKFYQRSAEGTAYYVSGSSMYFDSQSGMATIVEDGNDVYMKNPISRYEQNSWVKGVKTGNAIVVPARQPLAYNANYDATISLRWGVVSAEGKINVADDNADAFTFTIDGNKLVLEGTAAWDGSADAYYMGAFWDDDDSATGYGDAETVLTYDDSYVAPSTELVTVPETAEVAEWYMNGTSISSSGTSAVKNRVVKVAADDMDVYVQGLSVEFPESWVKGTFDDETGVITFPRNQYLGEYTSYQMWFEGFDASMGDLCDATAVYDFLANTISFNEQVAINAATDRLYYLERYDKVVLSMDEVEFTEPVITDLTAELPYANGFDTDAEQEEVAIYDANEDGYTFTFKDGVAEYSYSSSNKADDYLVFPGVELKAGEIYKVTVDAKAASNFYPERLEVVVGAEAKASKLNTVVVPETEITETEYATLSNKSFSVEQDGTYYFAVHATSEADQYRLYVDNFAVSVNDPMSPEAVTDLAVVADPSAALKATVTFTAPAKTVEGVAITAGLKANVTCGSETQTIDVEPGQAVETEVTVEEVGVHTVTVVISSDGHVSDVATAKAYIGEDVPGTVENLKGVDKSDKIALTWNAPSAGENGGVVVPENLKYNVYPVEMVDLFGIGWLFPETDYENPYVTGLTDTNAVVAVATNEGPQEEMYVAVTAENPVGESEDLFASVLVGAPYQMPLHEPFQQSGLATDWYTAMDDDNYNGEGNAYFTDVNSDGDGSGLMFVADCAGWLELRTGKFAVTGENPVLSFDYASDVPATVKVFVDTPDGEVVAFSQAVNSDEFTTAKVAMDEFVAQPFVRFAIRAEFSEAGDVFVDNVNLFNAYGENLAVTVAAPSRVEAGKTATITAKVQNLSFEATADYKVKFFVDDEEIAEVEGEEIGFYQTASLTAEYETSIFDEAGDKTVKVELVCNDDYDADNADEVVLSVVAPSATPVASVEAVQTEDGVTINWTVEDFSCTEVTEDFESGESWSQEFGGWTFVDVDGAAAGGIQGVDIPGHTVGQTPLSWFVFDSSVSENYVPHSGTKFMSTMFNYAGEANDDWMISPELPGVAQTISFWATELTDQYGDERMEVLYSTTDKELSSFVSLGTVDVTVEWHEFTYNLPEGTRYFAIRYVSQDVFMLWVDDVKYLAGGGTPTGFNVYVDEALVAALGADATSYTYTAEVAAAKAPAKAALTDGTHKFSVTAVYGATESAPVSVEIGVSTGINNVEAAQAAEIYTVDGIRLNSAKNLQPGVYVVNGKKVVVK